jgi:hypothetical protein
MTLRRLLVGLALLTVAATVERLVGLSAPMPTREAPSALRLEGYRVSAQGEEPPRRGRELSHGTLRRFRLQPLLGGPPLSVQVLPVRSRTGTEISEPSKERKGLNMVAVGVEVPAFALEGKRLLSVPRAGSQAADQVALGRGPGDGKERITRLQTCITPRGVVALSASTLAAQEPGQAPGGLVAALQRRTLRLAGLLPAHYECLAVQVEAEAKGADQAQLVKGWQALRAELLR